MWVETFERRPTVNHPKSGAAEGAALSDRGFHGEKLLEKSSVNFKTIPSGMNLFRVYGCRTEMQTVSCEGT